jgi:hypothetical protein
MNGRPSILALSTVACACDCESTSYVDVSATESEASDVSTSRTGTSSVLTGSSSEGDQSTGAPFDTSRWIGRYHYEHPYGEWGDPLYTSFLANFTIREDGTATMLYDRCSFDWPELVHYEWEPDEEPGWIELHPGAGQPYLRFFVDSPYESIRVHLIEPCRRLEFDGNESGGGVTHFYPGESCWLDRCGYGITLEVGYCEGEEPPPCP